MFPLLPKFSLWLQGCEKSGKISGKKEKKNGAFNKSIFMAKLVFFKQNKAVPPSRAPDAVKIKLGCPIHNFWTAVWMPIAERFDQEAGNHLFSLDVVKVIGSGFGKWHFPSAAGIALTAGQGLPARTGLTSQGRGWWRSTAAHFVLAFPWGQRGARSWLWDVSAHMEGQRGGITFQSPWQGWR